MNQLVEKCVMCGDVFVGDMFIQDETWNTEFSDEQATLMQEDWYSDDNICVVQGRTHREGLKTLVIWRNCKAVNNEQLCEFFKKMDFRTNDTEFDIIYVNGDNTLPNLRRDEEHWKLMLTEEEVQKRMFEEV